MSLYADTTAGTPPGVSFALPATRDTGGLDDTPAGLTDRDALLAHLGRDVIHASRTRDFAKAYYTGKDGNRRPRMYRVDSEAFTRCQYAMLTSKQYAAVLVVDIDVPGEPGGHPANLAPEVRRTFHDLHARNLGPSWVGINPQNGKAQAIWLVDPVYADATGKSRHMALLAAASRALGELLDHDPHFSHRFSRSPFYAGDDPTAYRWFCQHKRVHRLADLLKEVRNMADLPQYEKNPRQQFTSGRELITAVRQRREQAQAFKALAQDVENELADQLDRYDPELIDGVRVLWIDQGRAARDETAFRHALKAAHRLRNNGQRMTDAAIIDAYEHAYNVAQRTGHDGRPNEMPPMRDRQTMARRVRGYVTQSGNAPYAPSGAAGKATTSERKALATMGRKGGQKAAQRWKTDPEGDYAQQRRQALDKANRKRAAGGRSKAHQIAAYFDDHYAQTGHYPTVQEASQEHGVSARTVQRALAKAGIDLGSGGRPRKGDKP
ncbi:replicase RepA [Corynebacterium sp. zg912]|uniref:replication initiation protein n=1 Tax=Corynebacterium sp. zg912 TaxID=2656649 RepID=UPI00215197B3|nr:replication initiation protein [Corynebacterium sp. zg912]MCR5929947.1 replicase RepA [Corynebacterium sp. zg912]